MVRAEAGCGRGSRGRGGERRPRRDLSVYPGETQSSFGEAICPIIECSIPVPEGGVCFHFAKGYVDSSGKESLQFI